MAGDPFFIFSPTDMLAKAERELAQLRKAMSVDTVFNFFVTAYHVMDYVEALGTVSQVAITAMYGDPDFDACRFICNRGKHLMVTKYPKTIEIGYSGGSGGLGFDAISAGPINSAPQWRLTCDGTEIRPVELAERVIAAWQRFFNANGIA